MRLVDDDQAPEEVIDLPDLETQRSLGEQARARGHNLFIQHREKRFSVECSCGWRTPIQAKRATVFRMAVEHSSDAAFGRIPEHTGDITEDALRRVAH